MPGPFQGALYSDLNRGGYSGNYDNTVPTAMPETDNQVTPGAGSVAAPTVTDPWNVNPQRNNPAGPEAEQQALQAAATAREQKENKDKKDLQDNVDLRTKIAQMNLAEQKLAEANSPEAKAAASLAVELARVNLAEARLKLAQAQDPNNSPSGLAQLQNELAIRRDQLTQKAQRELQDDKIKAEWDQIVFQQDEIGNRQTQQIQSNEKIAENQVAATREGNTLQAATAVRGQDLSRQTAIDQFKQGMIANQIAAGQLSVDRAYKMLELDVQQRRLPSEIARNIGEAIAPIIPHLSAYKNGQVPNGFESGGPFEIAMRQSGAQSYDPNQYAVHPVGIDIMGMAKRAGAQVVNRPMQDPNTAIPDPQINTDLQPTPIPENLKMPDDIEASLKDQLAKTLQQTGQLNAR